MRAMKTLTAVAVVLGAAGAFAVACGGSSGSSAGPGDDSGIGDFPDGSVILPDGGVLLPDGNVVPLESGGGGDGSSGDAFVAGDAPGAGEAGPPPGCVSDNGTCANNVDCCSGTCTSGTCAPLNPGGTCKTLGNACGGNGDCCSGLCSGGACSDGSSFCHQSGDACRIDNDCCSGGCVVGASAVYGVCAPVPTGPSRCSGGVDGSLCNGCNDCCSRICAPYGTSGVKVCQRAEGCHVDGDLCRQDSDCCGAKGTGLPGDGNVTCDKSGSTTGVGVCRNPTGCSPEGNVCHYSSPLTCGIDSAPRDCCGALGSKDQGTCVPDSLGVPRCLAGKCANAGESCAFSGDCCGGLPCVPDSTGALKCGSTACEAKGASCTTNADCCAGLTCIPSAVGALGGTCGTVTPPPPGDAGPDGSTSDGSTTDAPTGDAITTDAADATPPTCALYGQLCKTDGDCCNGVPCTDNSSQQPCAGGTCSCHTVIK